MFISQPHRYWQKQSNEPSRSCDHLRSPLLTLTSSSNITIMRRTLFLTCALLLSIRSVSGQTCYFPDGTTADVHVPCGHGSQACCYYLDDSHHDLCFSNGFCFSWFFGSIYRGACTDESFSDSSGCATECIASRSLVPVLSQRSANGFARNL